MFDQGSGQIHSGRTMSWKALSEFQNEILISSILTFKSIYLA